MLVAKKMSIHEKEKEEFIDYSLVEFVGSAVYRVKWEVVRDHVVVEDMDKN